jgi:hypothetical protein
MDENETSIKQIAKTQSNKKPWVWIIIAVIIIIIGTGIYLFLSNTSSVYVGFDKFTCGTKLCNTETEYCAIAANDIQNSFQSKIYNCWSLPQGCKQGDCGCFNDDQFIVECINDSGYISIIYLGG